MSANRAYASSDPPPPSALISDCLDRFCALDAAIRPLTDQPICGPAFPVQTMAGENCTLHRALELVPPGWVLVVDAAGYVDRAVWGYVLTCSARSAGVAGAVIDGAIRDVANIRALGFPIFARAITPAGPHKGWRGRIDTPVCCGRVVVSKGDLIIGDDDGVVAVPANVIDEVLAKARDRARLETQWVERINAGQSSMSVLGLTD
jgi:4-hydroxy-4-methyl-2-oxoglutarate aldolase